MNYNDLTRPNSPHMVLYVGNSPPQQPYFRLVTYDNSPRGVCPTFFGWHLVRRTYSSSTNGALGPGLRRGKADEDLSFHFLEKVFFFGSWKSWNNVCIIVFCWQRVFFHFLMHPMYIYIYIKSPVSFNRNLFFQGS